MPRHRPLITRVARPEWVILAALLLVSALLLVTGLATWDFTPVR